MKDFTITIPSSNFHVKNTAGSNSDLTFNIDWGFLPNHENYELSFSFITKTSATLTGSAIISLLDLGSVVNTYGVKPSTTRATLSNGIVGYAESLITGATYYLKAELQTNPPVYLYGTPCNNLFRVVLKQIDNATNYVLADTIDYLLVLHFKCLNY